MIWEYYRTKYNPFSKIVVFDVETRGLSARPESFLFGVIYDGKRFYRYTTVLDMKNALFSFANSGFIAVAHNMEYDLTTLFDNVILASSKYIHRQRFLKLQFNPNRRSSNKRDKVLICIDSMNLFPVSLEQIGKVYGLEKLNTDYQFSEKITEDNWAYCERDCEVIYLAINKLSDIIKRLYNSNLRLTLASTSFQLAVNSFFQNGWLTQKESYYNMQISDKMQEIAKKSYIGGFTRALRKGKHKITLYHYDINSSYPYSMLQPYPDFRHCYTLFEPSRDATQKILDAYEGFSLIKVLNCNTKYPYLPLKIEKMVYYPLMDGWKTYISFPELRFLLAHSEYDIEIKELFYAQRLKSPFEYIYNLYKLKQENKKKNPALSYTAKILLNASYGKFAQKNYDESFIMDFEKLVDEFLDKKDLDGLEKWQSNFEYCTEKNGILCGYLKTKPIDAKHDIYSIASYITARSRVLLWEYSQDSYYCDTDSIFIPYKIKESKELGGWKLEDIATEIEIKGKKWYRYVTEDGQKITKIKGVTLEKEDADFGNIKKYKTMIKAKSSIRRNLKAGEFIEVEKHLNDFDDTILPKKFNIANC